MLYLEDFLELIEVLPEEMKDRLTELRELDLAVHKKSQEQMETNIRAFFQRCKHLRKDERAEEYKKLRKEYEKIVDISEEKVQLISQLHELTDRYARKLDQELSKFKLELEADHAGITEILEKKSLELDGQPQATNHRADRKRHLGATNHLDSKKSSRSYDSNFLGSSLDDLGGPGGSQYSLDSPYLPPLTPTSNPIAAAAAQAVAATQQMSHGRRTPSMRMTYEVMAKGLMPGSSPGGRGENSIKKSRRKATSAPADTEGGSGGGTSGSGSGGGRGGNSSVGGARAVVLSAPAVGGGSGEGDADGRDDRDRAAGAHAGGGAHVDPEEPRWCICNQVSYGDMVGCDYKDCPLEWFHYDCVGLTTAPKGKWYCPDCRQTMKRRTKDKREKH